MEVERVEVVHTKHRVIDNLFLVNDVLQRLLCNRLRQKDLTANRSFLSTNTTQVITHIGFPLE